MTEAEKIFEKHIGLNTELGYLPYKKEDIIDAINEALTIQRVSQQREQLIDFLTWYIHKSDMTEGAFSIKLIVDEYLKSINCC